MLELILPSLLAGLAAMAILVVVYFQLYLTQTKGFLGLWAAAWTAYLFRYTLLFWMPGQIDFTIVPILNGVLVMAGAYLLMLGCHGFLGQTPSRWLHIIMPAGLVLTLGCGALGLSLVVSTMPGSLAVSLTYLAAARILWASASLAPINRPQALVNRRQAPLNRRQVPLNRRLVPFNRRLAPLNRRLASMILVLWAGLQLLFPFQNILHIELEWGFFLGGGLQLLTALSILIIYFQQIFADFHQARVAQGESELKFSKAFRLSPVAMEISTLEEGRYLDVSDSFSELTGYSRDEVLGETSSELGFFAHGETRERLVKLLRERGSISSMETVVRLKSGEVRFVLISAELMEIGSTSCIIASILDITERKQSEVALDEMGRLFKSTFEQAAVGVFHLSPQGKYLRVNRRMCDMLGYTRAELLLMDLADTVSPQELDEGARLVARVLAGDIPSYTREKRYRRKDGSLMWGSLTVSMVTDDDGVPQYLIGMVEDINQRKKTDLALKKTNQLFQSTFEQAAVGIFHVSPQGRYLRVNQRMCTLLGYTRDEMLSMQFQQTTLPEDFAEGIAQVKKLLDGRVSSYSREKRYVRKDGSIMWGTLTVSLVREEDGSPSYLIGVVEDIGARRKVQEELKRAFEEKEILLREIHHRVKNNMQVVSSLLSIQESKIDDPASRAVFQESQDRIGALALIHQTLYQSHNLGAIDLQEYSEVLARRLQEVYQNSGAQVELTVQAHGVSISMDQSVPCGLVLNELISNALKYAFQGSSSGRIEVKAEVDDQDQVVLWVSDNGVGLPPDFDWDGSPTLGLSLVKGLVVNQLRGSLTMEGQGGARFHITFPAKLDED